jgi:hypothetical protein
LSLTRARQPVGAVVAAVMPTVAGMRP